MKKIITLLFVVFSLYNLQAQIKIENVILDYEVEYEGETLNLNGGGTRSSFILGDLYVGGLYLKEKSDDPISISYADEAMSIHLTITSRIINKDNLYKAIKEGFDKATNGDTKSLDDRIKKIRELYTKKFDKGDTIDFVYLKDQGVVCYFNKEKLGVIEGQDFKFALFKIWLGEKPVSKSLKAGMLGKA